MKVPSYLHTYSATLSHLTTENNVHSTYFHVLGLFRALLIEHVILNKDKRRPNRSINIPHADRPPESRVCEWLSRSPHIHTYVGKVGVKGM